MDSLGVSMSVQHTTVRVFPKRSMYSSEENKQNTLVLVTTKHVHREHRTKHGNNELLTSGPII